MSVKKMLKSNDLSLSARNLRQDRANPKAILDDINVSDFTNRLKELLSILDENEQKIHENKLLSLPIYIDKETKKKYIYDSIPGRLIRYREFWGYKYRVKGMKKSIFYQMLKKDIVELKYKQDFLDKVIFNSTSPIVRYIAINAKKIRNKFFFKR